MKLFSYKNRPVHLGPFPLETLNRATEQPDLSQVPPQQPLDFDRHAPDSIAHAIKRYMGAMDVTRAGSVTNEPAEVPDVLQERTNHLKGAGYYFDASMIGTCELLPAHLLEKPIINPEKAVIAKELASGIPDEAPPSYELFYPMVIQGAQMPDMPLEGHTHALVFLVEYARDPRADEPGTDWIMGTQAERAALLTANTATLIAEYIRLLGYDARAHSATTTDVNLNRLAVSAGLAGAMESGDGCELINPFVGSRFGLAAVTTNFAIAPDQPLGPNAGHAGLRSHGPKWWLGGQQRRAGNAEPFADRDFHMGPYPFEKIKRVETPTSLIDADRIPRFPKRADWFARSAFGDLGKAVQAQDLPHFVGKNPLGACALRSLMSLIPLQYGEARDPSQTGVQPNDGDPVKNAERLKAACYYLATDAVGLSPTPDWAYYSHDSKMRPITPYHKNSVNMMLDQGHETMEGASGDDWISSAQSMRAYLRFSLLGGVIGEQIRRQGYSARTHTVVDGELLLPPLMLLSGLGEISRIGDVILNPYLGPRLKSGAVSTSMPMSYDKPIDFGLQNFCDNCQKCARECPSGAISAGPKVMFNGYEIWRSDAEKCTRYRITNDRGAMCGRCMKTCPWNLEGLFADSAFRWLAINAPASAKTLAQLDDKLGRGSINPVKKWWWDVEINGFRGNRYVAAKRINARELSVDLEVRYEDQTLAAYTADTLPGPYPVCQPVDREAAINRYRELLSPEEYKKRLAAGDTEGLVPTPPETEPLAFPVKVARRIELTEHIFQLEFSSLDGGPVPSFEAGAHIDVVVTPEIQRQYSLAGDPADDSRYILGIQKEDQGRGGSKLIHAMFHEGRTVFVTPPRNHFPLDEDAEFTLLMGGGIGITPMIAMGHRLHALGKEFIVHFSAKTTEQSGYAGYLKQQPWADRVFFHFSQEGNRADINELIPQHQPGFKLYTCGGDRYMDGVFDTAEAKGWPEDCKSREYFSVPEQPDYENHPFILELTSSGRTVEVTAEQTATEALALAGVQVETKCSDGICGVCAVGHTSGDIEHRDFVLSKKERENKVILCCSRPPTANGVMRIAL
ncbi:MAG: 2Fe-2S iron-sulfur cluster binding domain-containing protein [Proteobacteria bacterium]|nr:2Fe-2S iron-sulfur cluster binding domain-containing protein [Pseudomonadota bacterium]